MKIRTDKTLTDRRYRVSVFTSDFSENQVERMVNYGEPLVNLGGTVGIVVYPDAYEKIMSGSPFDFSADGRDYATDAEAELAADAWATEMGVRIKAAVDAIDALDDTFTGETVETYP